MNEANHSITDQEIHVGTVLAPRVDPDPALTPTALDRLVFDRGFPLTAPGVATFAFRGDVESVRLVHFGIGLPDDLAFERIDDSNWWLLALALPEGTRLEYQIEIVEHGHHRTECDPLNPFTARNPFGQNSVCRSHGYAVPPWALHDPEAETGSRRSLTIPSAALDWAVPVTLYLPAGFSMEPEHRYPLLIVHDGSDYLHHAAAATVLDNLIHRGLVPEFVVAFCDPLRDRLVEYSDDERHAAFIVDELVPYLESHLPLIGDRDARCLGGASFGALATLSTAARHPDVFGRLMLQSGSFAGASGECIEPVDDLWSPVYDFVRRFTAEPTAVADKVFMSCGVFEPMITENRAIRPILKDTGMQVVMGEALDGHTWGCWRDLLGVALPWLFADSFRPREPRPFEPPVTDEPAPPVGAPWPAPDGGPEAPVRALFIDEEGHG
ncbi:MAG: esterase family protein [Ilumatobacter sp.]|nr:esterase family protein [Ilumatobacter sp.]